MLLILSLGVVIFAMRGVRRPENVLRVAQVFAVEADPASSRERPDQPPPTKLPDSFQASNPGDSGFRHPSDAPNEAASGPNLRELLSLAGWTSERFSEFAGDRPLSAEERNELIQLMWRLRTFDAASLESWAQKGPSLQALSDDAAAHRGEMVSLEATVVQVERHELSAQDAARYEMAAYYTCELAVADEGGRAIVLTPIVPEAWGRITPFAEPVSAAALFVKRLPTENDSHSTRPANLFVAKRIAWHPTAPREPAVSFGESVLGTLGMDVGQLDDIHSRGPIRSAEREAFYQMLDAAGQIGPNQLVRFAQGNLASVGRQWAGELAATPDDKMRALAQEVVRRAQEGRYSVAPLFNDAPRQIGQLVVVDGAARRVVRIDVGSRPGGSGPSDVARRFGIDHYYEMEVFTDDSQNYPLVFCVRELPAGFPTGEGLHLPVRVAGFFFKDWLYTTRGTRDATTGDIKGGTGQPQYAPLLIGRAPLVLQVEPGGGDVARLVGGGLFLLALASIWAAAWWFARSDQKFVERRRAAAFSLPPGQSLNELKLSGFEEPMNLSSVDAAIAGRAVISPAGEPPAATFKKPASDPDYNE